jgi:hypothetical protein
MRLSRTWGLLALAFLGCRPIQSGALTASGFKHEMYPLEVPSTSSAGIVGGYWQVDNFYTRNNINNRPTWTAKDGPAYLTSYRIDNDGDGEFESSVRANVYDLRFTHVQHDGVIFLRTVPISQNQQNKRLDVLLHRYVEGIAGAGYEVTALDDSTVDVVEKRFAATIVREGQATIGALPAYAATIDIKNLDQLRADPSAKGTSVELVLAHTSFSYVARRAGTTQMGAEIAPQEFPVLLIAGYSNRHGDFAESLPEFRAFLSQIRLNGIAGASVTYPDASPSPGPADSPRPRVPEPNAPPSPLPTSPVAPATTPPSPSTPPAAEPSLG